MTKPNPENCKNCSSKWAYHCAQLQYTIHHRTVLIIFHLPSRVWVIPPAGWLPRNGISSNHLHLIRTDHGTISVEQSSGCSMETGDDTAHFQATTQGLSVPHLMCRRTEGTSTAVQHCCGVFHVSGAGYKTADLLTYLRVRTLPLPLHHTSYQYGAFNLLRGKAYVMQTCTGGALPNQLSANSNH